MHDKALSWDDVTLVPQFSEIGSRSEPNTSCVIGAFSGRTVPIISANMDTVTECAMAIAMWKMGGVGALHRFMSLERLIDEYQIVRTVGADCFISIGVKDVKNIVETMLEYGASHFMVDIAHGHCTNMRDTLESLRRWFGDAVVIAAGNVATPEGVCDLAKWGADIVKCGIGAGAACKTRLVTGHGVPMFSSVLECSRMADNIGIQLIADGGMKTSGDIVKAFVAGADSVMLGSLLAATNEAPGDTVYDESTSRYSKSYRGMASAAAQSDRGGNGDIRVAAEGVSTLVPCKGPVTEVIEELMAGLRSGMSYCNAKKLSEIHSKAKWREQSGSAYFEGTPHILRGK